jgi:hypothetical protein
MNPLLGTTISRAVAEQFSRAINARSALFTLWIVIAIPTLFFILQPFLFKISAEEIRNSPGYKSYRDDVQQQITRFNKDIQELLHQSNSKTSIPSAKISALLQNYPQLAPAVSTDLPEYDNNTDITLPALYRVNFFWVLDYSIVFHLSQRAQSYSLNSVSDEIKDDLGSPRPDELALIYTVSGLLILLPLFVSMPSQRPVEEGSGEKSATQILFEQMRYASDQVRFVRYMALFQLSAGVIIAFMGIVVFGVLFSKWALSDHDDGSELRLQSEATLDAAARMSLLGTIYGPDAADNVRQELRYARLLEAFKNSPVDRRNQSLAQLQRQLLDQRLLEERRLQELRLAQAQIVAQQRQDGKKIPGTIGASVEYGELTPAVAKASQSTIPDLLSAQRLLTTFEPSLTAEPSFWRGVNWPGVIRSIGILFFIEAVAWFLLQQYRRSMEDYKEFHRRSLKRSNYHAAYEIARTRDMTREQVLVLSALLTEELTGRLKPGETTEGTDAAKVDASASNPVFSLFQAILTNVLPAKAAGRETG